MNSQTTLTNSSSSSNSSTSSSTDSQSDSRLTVADILSSMANGEIITTSYTTLDGFSTGIPTRTTPTLTPTTLRNIEQTFIELQSVPPPIQHQHQAGFVPPIVHTNSTTPTSQSTTYQHIPVKEENVWYTCSASPTKLTSKTTATRQNNALSTNNVTSSNTTTKSSGRHMGGRRPNRDEKLSPEEEERRRIRRERNKLAAARCRKRRMDHTNCLLTETEGLEDKKQSLQKEISELQSQKEHLEFILEAHRCLCKNGKIVNNGIAGVRNGDPMKDVIVTSADSITASSNTTVPTTFSDTELPHKPLARPTSLPISCNFTMPSTASLKQSNSVSNSEIGIPISTPSNGIFNFEALMEGGTGLTPVSMGYTPVIPTCSSQQRNSSSDLSSPDNMNPPKLVSL